MTAIFEPPVVFDNPAVLPDTHGVQYELFKYYGPYPSGVTVVGPYPEYTSIESPLQTDLVGTEGTDYFHGGHVYVVTDEVAAALEDSGYTTSATVPDTSGTWGHYDETPWGELGGYQWGEL